MAWGGVGKSAMVNTWLRRMDSDGWCGAERVFGWSFYSQGTDRLTSSDEFFAVALCEFGDTGPAPTSPWDKGERLAKLVRRERALLVLDGLEPLQWGPGVQEGRLKDQALEALLKELAAQNRGTCIITSRIKVTDLDALRGDKVRPLDLDHLVPEAGAKILRARGATGLVGELRAASEEYDGHSLSLTLLGNYLREAHKGDIRARRHIPLGEKPAQRMMGTYERWFQDKPELAILRLLGFFDRPAPQDEIGALLAQPPIAGLTDKLDGLGKSAWNEAVTALQDVGLLARGVEGDNRLDAHPLVREYFGAQLRTAQPETWREGHRRLHEHLKGKAKPLPETVEEMVPLYAAVVHGCMAGKNQEALEEVYLDRIQRRGVCFNSHKLGAFGNAAAVLSAFFDPPWERLAPGLSERSQAWVLNEAGFTLRALGRLAEATDLLRLSLKQCVSLEGWKEAALRGCNLSELLQTRGELRDAKAAALESVAHADRSGNTFARMLNRTTLAAALHALGRRYEAAALFEEAERMWKVKFPAFPHLSLLLGSRHGDLLLDQGREADVLARVAQTQKVAERDRSLLSIALDHLSLGRAHHLAARSSPPPAAQHHAEQAAHHLQQAVDGLRRAGYQEILPLGLLARAAFRTHTHAFADARHDLTEALTLATRCGFRLHEADAYLGFARLALAERDPAAAADHLAKARAIIDATSYHRRDDELRALEAEAHELAKPPPPAHGAG